MLAVSWLWIALLAASVVVLVAAEWPRLSGNLGAQARAKRERARRKQQFKLLKSESEEFAASVEKDLSQLPTIEERDRRR
jgi:cell division protein FtsB